MLDSGGISALALNDDLLDAYLHLILNDFDGALIVPIPVLTEVRSGARNVDVKTDRLLKKIGGGQNVFSALGIDAAMRAGVLRTEALATGVKHDISAIDAQIVAMAEKRSLRNAVTLITSDAKDIGLLVDLSRRSNIAIDVVQ